MKNLKNISKALVVFILLPFSSTIFAKDLLKFYQLAKDNDPTIHEARETYFAKKESLPQSVANLLPTLSGSASTTGHNTNSYLYHRYNVNQYSVSLSQPLVDYSKWIDYGNSTCKVKSAHATWTGAQQSLILRVVTLYLDVLGAMDDLELAKAKRREFARQLEQTSQRYNVGLIAITDVHEAQARRDGAYAEEILASNVLKDKKENLSQVVGVNVDKIKRLRDQIELKTPQPSGIDAWVQRSQNENFNLKAARYDLKVTKSAILEKKCLHLPTLSLSGGISNTKNLPGGEPSRKVDRQIGLTLSVPIFQGGYVHSKHKEAVYSYKAARHAYERLFRSTQSKARESYRGVITQISQVQALNQAVISNQSALNATKDAFKVGTRTITDVLNAQSALLTAKRDYSKARYKYLINNLTLKEAAGILKEDDLIKIDELLEGKK